MAERVQVEFFDDIDGSTAQETVRFALDGVAYVIDLNRDHARTLRSLLTIYTRAGRAKDHTTAASQTQRIEDRRPRTQLTNERHTREIRQAADVARRHHPPQSRKSHPTKPEPTAAAFISDIDRSRRQATPARNTSAIAPVEFSSETR